MLNVYLYMSVFSLYRVARQSNKPSFGVAANLPTYIREQINKYTEWGPSNSSYQQAADLQLSYWDKWGLIHYH